MGPVEKQILSLLVNGKVHSKDIYKALKPRHKAAVKVVIQRLLDKHLLFQRGLWLYDAQPAVMADCDNIYEWRRDVDDDSPARLWIWPESVFPCLVSYAPSEYGDFTLVNSVGYDDIQYPECNLSLWA